MKFEVIESTDEWVVRSHGEEVARYRTQDEALNDVAERLRAAPAGGVSVALRYGRRTG